ncbi:MAG: hypothetical protein M1839_005949 [Geoglossum umbratile]|nr:MAG: hypothetical protein M1839_005949 [Geoglossum umbratile]
MSQMTPVLAHVLPIANSGHSTNGKQVEFKYLKPNMHHELWRFEANMQANFRQFEYNINADFQLFEGNMQANSQRFANQIGGDLEKVMADEIQKEVNRVTAQIQAAFDQNQSLITQKLILSLKDLESKIKSTIDSLNCVQHRSGAHCQTIDRPNLGQDGSNTYHKAISISNPTQDQSDTLLRVPPAA